MQKETEETIVFFVTFLSLVAFQLGGRGGGLPLWLRLWLYRYWYFLVIMAWDNTWKHFFKRSAVFVFKSSLKIFLGRSHWRNQKKGASAPFSQIIRRFNPKLRAFKHVLDLTWSIRRAEGARHLKCFNNFWVVAIYCSYWCGFKHVQMWLRWRKTATLPQKCKKITQRLEASPQVHSVIRLSCISLFRTGSKLDNFCAKKILLLVTLLVVFTAADGFFKRL